MLESFQTLRRHTSDKYYAVNFVLEFRVRDEIWCFGSKRRGTIKKNNITERNNNQTDNRDLLL